jgi:fido (protein-threonine AMPylation protein)
MKQKIRDLLPEEKRMRLNGGLHHQTQIKFAFNSNRIEGSRLSEDQTRYIFETNSVNTAPDEAVNVDDIIETVNHFACFDYMLEHVAEEISEEMLKEFHRLLKRGTSDERKERFRAGDYKTRPNMVGDIQTTAPDKVSTEMKQLIADYREKEQIMLDDIVEFHYKFEVIHPFQDGNGRVGRIIMFKECLKYDIMPFIIYHEHKLFYYRGLKEFAYEKGYLNDTCLSAQDRYKATVAYFYPEFQSDTQTRAKPDTTPIIPELVNLFWNHDTNILDMDHCRDLVILTTLKRGSFEQIQLIFQIYGMDEVRRVFRADTLGHKTLPAPAVYLWGMIFLDEAELAAYKKWHEDPIMRWMPTRTFQS